MPDMTSGIDNNINDLAADYFAALLHRAPTWAHMLGEYDDVGRHEDATAVAERESVATLRDFAARADALTGLTGQDAITAAVISSSATASADLTDAGLIEIAANPIFGVQVSLPIVIGMLGVPDATVAEAMVAKYHSIGQHYRDLAQRQLDGVAHGRTTARFAVEATLAQLDAALALPVAEDPLLVRVQTPAADVDVEAWKARLADAIETSVRPGIEVYRDALRDVVLPAARPDDKVGLCWLDGGDDAYARALRHYTTTDKTAKEIHEIGLAQVAALADEYRALGPAVVGSDDLEAIFTALRTDPALHFETAEQLVEQSRVAMARAAEAMPAWFEVLPQAPCAVEGTTTGAKAFYYPPAPDGSRGGTFFVNVTQPEAWGTFELESMAFHEGIPGHHLQLAIASELPDSVPAFRKHLHNSAYAEGWGLYTERLSDEMGLYSGDLDRMGMLSADSMRACRLVVDTGLHALGWSREQAVDYMVDNSPMARAAVQAEIDRYICSPGQATSYMIGRIEIQRMRAEAEERQGEAFDVKVFHSAVLDSGSLPLGVLDEVVAARLP
jgi:uncharacterized protein (DUF885 family)